MKPNLSTPLLIPALKDFESKGFNRNALLLVQRRMLEEAMRIYKPNDPKIMERAAELAPPKDMMVQSYTQSLVHINKGDVNQLEKVSQHLLWIEGHLDRQYTKAMAKNLPMGKFAEQQGEVANVYAGVIHSARELEKAGVVSVTNSKDLRKLTEKPEGALQEIHQKALAILDSEGQNENIHRRERMAA